MLELLCGALTCKWHMCPVSKLAGFTDGPMSELRRYDDRDSVRWPGFDFVQGDSDSISLFEPDADFTYR